MKEEVIQGDCLIEMQKIPDKSIDMVIETHDKREYSRAV